MREYETVLVIRPDASESGTKTLLERVDSIIDRHGGTILQKKEWGKRELAYQVRKFNQGVYYYYDYSGEPGVVAELERSLKLHELPMKYLTVQLAKDVDVKARQKEIASVEEAAKVSPAQEVKVSPAQEEKASPAQEEKASPAQEEKPEEKKAPAGKEVGDV